MELDIRPAAHDELSAFARAVDTAFGIHATDEMVAVMRSMLELDRSLAVVDEGVIVAGAAALSLELTLPGLTTIPAAAVTEVGVLPTHRRRGMLTALMRRQLDDVAERGEPVAVLRASESTIYGRFGYGIAAVSSSVEIDTAGGARAGPPAGSGRLRFVDGDGMRAALAVIHDRYRLVQPGEVSRSDGWWDAFVLDPELFRGDASARFAVVYEDGEGAGYVTYRMKVDWLHDELHTLLVEDMVATTPQARTALWQYCLGVDLVTTVRAPSVPVDEPFPWTMPDPGRFRVTGLYDLLWLRLVDVAAALAARRYGGEGRIVFEVADRFRPAGAGRYILDAGTGGAECRRAAADEADLALEVADLGAAYIGGVRFSTLARAGRVWELRPGALGRADALFASTPLPWCSTDF